MAGEEEQPRRRAQKPSGRPHKRSHLQPGYTWSPPTSWQNTVFSFGASHFANPYLQANRPEARIVMPPSTMLSLVPDRRLQVQEKCATMVVGKQ
uniref:Uncharacterized protein n=1 Tax=Strigamia maritima TaxID=126957 RepID=T1J851_STRMM